MNNTDIGIMMVNVLLQWMEDHKEDPPLQYWINQGQAEHLSFGLAYHIKSPYRENWKPEDLLPDLLNEMLYFNGVRLRIMKEGK